MTDLPPTLSQIAAFLAVRLPSAANADVPLRWRVPEGVEATFVRTIVLALDTQALGTVENRGAGDALLLHRPFDLPPTFFPDLPILAVHKAFDTHFALGFNPPLADALGLTQLEEMWRVRPGRPDERIGMIGALAEPTESPVLRDRLIAEFGGLDEELTPATIAGPIERMAVMGAMSTDLISHAVDRGASVYVTGQFRENSRAAALRRGIAVIAVGHRRSELWGLRRLAGELQAAFPTLRAFVRE